MELRAPARFAALVTEGVDRGEVTVDLVPQLHAASFGPAANTAVTGYAAVAASPATITVAPPRSETVSKPWRL